VHPRLSALLQQDMHERATLADSCARQDALIEG